MQSTLSSDSGLSHRAESFQASLLGRITLVVAASVLVAACAHVTLPLPFTPVPLTLQTFAVILIGMFLGPIAGFSAMMLYLAEGESGRGAVQKLSVSEWKSLFKHRTTGGM